MQKNPKSTTIVEWHLFILQEAEIWGGKKRKKKGKTIGHLGMGGLVISRATCRAISARRRTTAHIFKYV
jgi:hypothetical protein